MNVDELIRNIKKVSSEKDVQALVNLIELWKTDRRNAINLNESVERFFENVWVGNQADHEKIYRMWSEFRASAIDRIGGMTMNERLYWFGLF